MDMDVAVVFCKDVFSQKAESVIRPCLEKLRLPSQENANPRVKFYELREIEHQTVAVAVRKASAQVVIITHQFLENLMVAFKRNFCPLNRILHSNRVVALVVGLRPAEVIETYADAVLPDFESWHILELKASLKVDPHFLKEFSDRIIECCKIKPNTERNRKFSSKVFEAPSPNLLMTNDSKDQMSLIPSSSVPSTSRATTQSSTIITPVDGKSSEVNSAASTPSSPQLTIRSTPTQNLLIRLRQQFKPGDEVKIEIRRQEIQEPASDTSPYSATIQIPGSSTGINLNEVEVEGQVELSSMFPILSKDDPIEGMIQVLPGYRKLLDEHMSCLLSKHFQAGTSHRQDPELFLMHQICQARSDQFPTEMHFAAYYGLERVVWTLLEEGEALPFCDEENSQGSTPLDLAQARGFGSTVGHTIQYYKATLKALNFFKALYQRRGACLDPQELDKRPSSSSPGRSASAKFETKFLSNPNPGPSSPDNWGFLPDVLVSAVGEGGDNGHTTNSEASDEETQFASNSTVGTENNRPTSPISRQDSESSPDNNDNDPKSEIPIVVTNEEDGQLYHYQYPPSDARPVLPPKDKRPGLSAPSRSSTPYKNLVLTKRVGAGTLPKTLGGYIVMSPEETAAKFGSAPAPLSPSFKIPSNAFTHDEDDRESLERIIKTLRPAPRLFEVCKEAMAKKKLEEAHASPSLVSVPIGSKGSIHNSDSANSSPHSKPVGFLDPTEEELIDFINEIKNSDINKKDIEGFLNTWKSRPDVQEYYEGKQKDLDAMRAEYQSQIRKGQKDSLLYRLTKMFANGARQNKKKLSNVGLTASGSQRKQGLAKLVEAEHSEKEENAVDSPLPLEDSKNLLKPGTANSVWGNAMETKCMGSYVPPSHEFKSKHELRAEIESGGDYIHMMTMMPKANEEDPPDASKEDQGSEKEVQSEETTAIDVPSKSSSENSESVDLPKTQPDVVKKQERIPEIQEGPVPEITNNKAEQETVPVPVESEPFRENNQPMTSLEVPPPRPPKTIVTKPGIPIPRPPTPTPSSPSMPIKKPVRNPQPAGNNTMTHPPQPPPRKRVNSQQAFNYINYNEKESLVGLK